MATFVAFVIDIEVVVEFFTNKEFLGTLEVELVPNKSIPCFKYSV